VAGTVFPGMTSRTDEGLAGVAVQITDAAGHALALQTNLAGNFYSDEQLTMPITIDLQLGAETRHMEPSATYGGCNRCHNDPPSEGAEGWAYIEPSP
jgi:hypothetical protein